MATPPKTRHLLLAWVVNTSFFSGGYNDGIWWGPNSGAHEVHGLISSEYAGVGYECSPLGLPLADDSSTTNRPGGVWQPFDQGGIWYSGATGAHEVHGLIANEYSYKGYEGSLLAFPTTDEMATNCAGGRYNNFQGGAITWFPSATAAHWTWGSIRDIWGNDGFECGVVGYPTSEPYDSYQDYHTQIFSNQSITAQDFTTPLSWAGSGISSQVTFVFCSLSGCQPSISPYNAYVGVDSGITGNYYNVPTWYRDYHDGFELDISKQSYFTGYVSDYHSALNQNVNPSQLNPDGCYAQYRTEVCALSADELYFQGKSQRDVVTGHTLFAPHDASTEVSGDQFWVAYTWTGQ